jgi:hypothetical protein
MYCRSVLERKAHYYYSHEFVDGWSTFEQETFQRREFYSLESICTRMFRNVHI